MKRAMNLSLWTYETKIKSFKTQHDVDASMVEATALLVQRRRYREPNLLSEFEALATTAEYTVVGTFDIVSAPSAKYAIRSGKAEEIQTWIEVNEPEFVLFSPGLKSGQVFRLMDLWKTEVRDRTQVILEIFDKHARTPQARLQIEHARLKYELPFERHQIRMRLQKEHTGDRPVAEQIGAGEDLLNLRIKEIRRRLATINEKLKKIVQEQKLKKKKRIHEGFIELTLAGYTNSGKSTLHRALTGSEVKVADELFTTLSTKASELEMPGRRVVLSDSVGFISDLPKTLLQAFNTTIMEVSDADVIILVVDASDSVEEMERKVEACLDTFNKIDVNGIPIITALNKIDLLDELEIEERRLALPDACSIVIEISAQQHTNLTLLVETVKKELPLLHKYEILLPYGDDGMSTLSWLHEAGDIESEEYVDEHIEIVANLSNEVAQKLGRELPAKNLRRIDAK
ncbi:MAG: GTPase HflX [Candidatus Thorarchaeota archaeon]|nr:MAG: GTPase HflX [Candidatus Thorarchaeota archaeon]